ncbi:hypothetical protein ACFRU3_33140 [Streptomyces sp. NPDC056910]|uniref:hypothetical protein n=1 Tax=Streptomyces sp. NPDC056910 TaxID=3345964 RepID=UPI0036738ECE
MLAARARQLPPRPWGWSGARWQDTDLLLGNYLAISAWLLPLNSVKVFPDSPAPEVDGEVGRVSVLRWLATAYLARGSRRPCERAPSPHNPFVHLGPVDVAAAVPRHVVTGLSRWRRATTQVTYPAAKYFRGL